MDVNFPARHRPKSFSFASKWLGIDRDLWVTGVLVIGSILGGLLIVIWYRVPKPAAAFLWAFACLAVGSLLGFLFAIPRAISGRDDSPGKGQLRPRLAANTNIEQISDWLTKLLVGVGLVELKDLPHGLMGAAAFVAHGLGSEDALVQFSAALLVFFPIEGFLGGYLATRIFFQGIIERSDMNLEELENEHTP